MTERFSCLKENRKGDQICPRMIFGSWTVQCRNTMKLTGSSAVLGREREPLPHLPLSGIPAVPDGRDKGNRMETGDAHIQIHRTQLGSGQGAQQGLVRRLLCSAFPSSAGSRGTAVLGRPVDHQRVPGQGFQTVVLPFS